MKTTVDIPDSLLEDVRQLAAREKTTVRALIEAGLRRELRDRRPARDFRLRRAAFGGRGLREDLAGASWEQIRDLSYEGRG